ncbi:MAG: hypothetical protein ACREEJ_25725 [Ensifer adhaerens]
MAFAERLDGIILGHAPLAMTFDNASAVRRADGSFDEARGWGWFVGWAQKDDKTFVLARLIQDDRKEPGTPACVPAMRSSANSRRRLPADRAT